MTILVRPDQLPEAATVDENAALIIGNGTSVLKATPAKIIQAGLPVASQAEAEAGVDDTKLMPALRVKQAIDAIGVSASALEGPGGAALIGTQSHVSGAIERTQKDKNNDWVSVFDFIDSAYHSDILDGSSTQDVAAIVQSAIDSGENLLFPGYGGSRYLIDGRLQMKNNYQRLFSTGGVRLDFRGVDNTMNALEILSTRRDAGGVSTTNDTGDGSTTAFAITRVTSAQTSATVYLDDVKEELWFSSPQRLIYISIIVQNMGNP